MNETASTTLPDEDVLKDEHLSANSKDWYELLGRKDEFQNIVRLLVTFDEKTGRHLQYRDPFMHTERKAIADGDPDKLRFFIRPIGSFVYVVIAELSRDLYRIVTSWIHEDGIRVERNDSPVEHPVHTIVCVTDLVASEGRKIQTSELSILDEGVQRSMHNHAEK